MNATTTKNSSTNKVAAESRISILESSVSDITESLKQITSKLDNLSYRRSNSPVYSRGRNRLQHRTSVALGVGVRRQGGVNVLGVGKWDITRGIVPRLILQSKTRK